MKIKIGKYPKRSDAKRKVKIRIDPYDTWGMDETLALIIIPLLKQLKGTKQGSPLVDDCDVPHELKSTSAPAKEREWDLDDNHHKRWEWALDEMIWSFEQHTIEWEQQYFHEDEIDREGMKAHAERMKNGRMLLAKYYDALWD